MTSQTVWNISLFEHFFKVLSLYWKVKIRIRIRIKVKGRIRIRIKVMQIHNTAYLCGNLLLELKSADLEALFRIRIHNEINADPNHVHYAHLPN